MANTLGFGGLAHMSDMLRRAESDEVVNGEKVGTTTVHLSADTIDWSNVQKQLEVRDWSPERVKKWLEECGFKRFESAFGREKIDGEQLLELTMDQLKYEPLHLQKALGGTSAKDNQLETDLANLLLEIGKLKE
ncbi:hypothetical protein RFI_07627, partial [Reticulomyxa filosa]